MVPFIVSSLVDYFTIRRILLYDVCSLIKLKYSKSLSFLSIEIKPKENIDGN
jgi:hypothetical protein